MVASIRVSEVSFPKSYQLILLSGRPLLPAVPRIVHMQPKGCGREEDSTKTVDLPIMHSAATPPMLALRRQCVSATNLCDTSSTTFSNHFESTTCIIMCALAGRRARECSNMHLVSVCLRHDSNASFQAQMETGFSKSILSQISCTSTVTNLP